MKVIKKIWLEQTWAEVGTFKFQRTFIYLETFYLFMRVLTAVLHKEEDMYVAKCPEIGTVSQGSTVEEAVANLKEATELYLEEFPAQPI